MSPKALYQQKLEEEGFHADPGQERAVEALERLSQELISKTPSPLWGEGRGEGSCSPKDIAILSYGGRLQEALKAAKELEAKGQTVTVADARFAKPLDEALIDALVNTHKTLITIEEGSIGGFGSFVLEYLSRSNQLDGRCRVKTMHLPDTFQDQDDPARQYSEAGLTADDILKVVS